MDTYLFRIHSFTSFFIYFWFKCKYILLFGDFINQYFLVLLFFLLPVLHLLIELIDIRFSKQSCVFFNLRFRGFIFFFCFYFFF